MYVCMYCLIMALFQGWEGFLQRRMSLQGDDGGGGGGGRVDGIMRFHLGRKHLLI